MRATILILLTALVFLWCWFLVAVDAQDTSRPVLLEAARTPGAARTEEVDAWSLNDEGVRLDRQGRRADALAYFERAHSFRPRDEAIAANLERQRARVERGGWLRLLAPATAAGVVLLLLAGSWRAARSGLDHARLARLRLRTDPWVRVRPGDGRAALDLRFSEPVGCLLRRHPLTIVWSSAAHGKHMKSRPPVEAKGREVRIVLEGERLERLRRFPGEWKGFLYLGKTPVGEAAARVG